MSLEDAVEEYAKKWKVSKEEAQREVLRILKKAGNPDPEEKKKVPSSTNIFPEPIGELSRKVQDINQAALSTAYARRLLNTPPEDVMALREKIERTERIVDDLKLGLEEQIRKLTETLEDKKRKETREELLKELDEKMTPIREGFKALAEKLEKIEKGEPTTGAGGELKPSDILKEADKIAEDAKSWLGKLGYRVEPEKLSKEEVQRMIEEAQKQALVKLPPDELKKRLEESGYKIVGGPLTYDQVEKLLEDAKRRAQEEVLDDKRIAAVENIIRDSVKEIVSMFKPAVQMWVDHSLKGMAEGSPPSSGPTETET